GVTHRCATHGSVSHHTGSQVACDFALRRTNGAYEENVDGGTVTTVKRFRSVTKRLRANEDEMVVGSGDEGGVRFGTIPLMRNSHRQRRLLVQPTSHHQDELWVHMLDNDNRRREIGRQVTEDRGHSRRASGG